MFPKRASPHVAPNLELELAAAPATIPLARAAISRTCEGLCVADDVAERVRLAVTEACANCAQHAYGRECWNPTYMLETRVEGCDLFVVVHDCGRGLRGGATESAAAGLGLGLGMIERLADGIEIASEVGHGTRLEMRFSV